jgi:hypothetical protein
VSRRPAWRPAWCTDLDPLLASPPQPDAARSRFAAQHPLGLLFGFPKQGHSLARDFKWTGSHRYAIVHLGAADRDELRHQAERASALFGWPAPYSDHSGEHAPAAAPTADWRNRFTPPSRSLLT